MHKKLALPTLQGDITAHVHPTLLLHDLDVLEYHQLAGTGYPENRADALRSLELLLLRIH